MDLVRAGRDEFNALRSAWRDLHAAARVPHPFASDDWLANWLSAFGDDGHEVVAVREGEELVAGWLARRTRNGLTALDEHTYHSEPIHRPGAGLEALLSHLGRAGERRLDMHGPRSPSRRAELEQAASGTYLVLERFPWSMRRVDVGESLDAYLATRDAKTLAELRRKRRRFEERAPGARLVRIGREDPRRAFALVEEVERASWKFDEGTAIASAPAELAFYRGILGLDPSTGEPVVYALLDGERPLACLYGILRDRVLYALKCSYRDDAASLSPGLVLVLAIVESLSGERIASAIELLGRDSRWKREVATSEVEHCVHELSLDDVAARLHSLANRHVRPLLARLQQARSKS